MATILFTENEKSISYKNNKMDLLQFIGEPNIDKMAFDYLKNLEEQEISGLNIEDFYLYDNIPLYIFERANIYSIVKKIIFYIFILEEVIRKTHKEIIIETDEDLMLDIGNNIFNLKCYKVDKFSPIKKYKRSIIYFKLFIRIIKGNISYFKFILSRKKNLNILAISNSMCLNEVKIDDKVEIYDTQLGTILEELEKENKVLNLERANLKLSGDKSLKYNKDYVPFEMFILFKRLNRKFKTSMDLIVDKTDLLKKVNYKYKGYDLRDIMLKYVFKSYQYNCITDYKELIAAELFLTKYKIDKCIMIGEGDRGRCFISAANKLNIGSYAVQHGIINDTSPSYIINSKYKNIVPKITFLWGNKYKKILINNSNVYSQENVKICGQARTDLLFNNCYNENFGNKNSIKILYATQYFKDILEPATNMLFKSLNLLEEGYELIIKMHPGDSYKDVYEELIKKYNIKNVSIIKGGDLYSLLNWCDVTVSVHSTVVLEGALLKKPSICIILPNYNDRGGFVKDGISKGAENEKELAGYLVNYKSIYKSNIDQIDNYIKDNFYKVDGNVTKRIVETILSN